ncbi:MAG: carbamoyltransferase HypF [SAR324 cluster bacterium]|nr:carbamoyltransferase HypF [SAR324 cluster bacterium]
MNQRLKIELSGVVQGVGFRPFVARLAENLSLCGEIQNNPQGVEIVLEGSPSSLYTFKERLESEKPAQAKFYNWHETHSKALGLKGFTISESVEGGETTAAILPDLAPCPECLEELTDPNNRRFGYPFLNCTHCGPRYSIIKKLPYDRDNTVMSGFRLCSECEDEYQNPKDRRYHAQPTACPACGPTLNYFKVKGSMAMKGASGFKAATDLIESGGILAWKGVGGYLLSCRADDEQALKNLRTAKSRKSKPFALLVKNIEMALELCEVSETEMEALCSVENPIVILKAKKDKVDGLVAPDNPYLGIMLPSSPLHHMIMAEINYPIVATSANSAGEPLSITEDEAFEQLSGIADGFLTHNRPILRRIDDSIAQVVNEDLQILRRARGYAPLPILVNEKLPNAIGLGGDLKSTLALSRGNLVFLSQHLGDLDEQRAQESFSAHLIDLQELLDINPVQIFGDQHPRYRSLKIAEDLGLEVENFQHHAAHAYGLRAESGTRGKALAFVWDGTGLGKDKQIWGGEVFQTEDHNYQHVKGLKPFRLLGGEVAAKEPLRIAFALLHSAIGAEVATSWAKSQLHLSEFETSFLSSMAQTGLNSPECTSMGRLFDGISALLGLNYYVEYEGQAAMMLEWALDEQAEQADIYTFEDWDWSTMIKEIWTELQAGVPKEKIAASFHNSLVAAIVAQATELGINQILMTGGCFQNRYLTTLCNKELKKVGLEPIFHKITPPNDGSLGLGQLWMGVHNIKEV